MGSISKRQTSRGVRWYAQVRKRSKGRIIHAESKTFHRKALAEAWVQRREHELAENRAYGRKPGRSMTLSEMIERYLSEVGQNYGRSKVFALSRLQHDDLAGIDAGELAVADLIDFAKRRREGGAGPVTINQDLIFIRTVLRYGRHAWRVECNPVVVGEALEVMRHARMVARPRRRTRRPTAEELEALDDFFRDKDPRSSYPMRLIMWLAIYSGRREAELCRIRRSDLDEENGVYLVRDLKNPSGSAGNDKYLRMPAPGWPVVRRILAAVEPVDDLLLPLSAKAIGAYFRQACKLLGIDDLRFHDLRHEALSRLAEDGYTIPEIQTVSGHETWESLRIYVNLPPVRGRRAEFDPEV